MSVFASVKSVSGEVDLKEREGKERDAAYRFRRRCTW